MLRKKLFCFVIFIQLLSISSFAKENIPVDVYLIMGQSNAVGTGKPNQLDSKNMEYLQPMPGNVIYSSRTSSFNFNNRLEVIDLGALQTRANGGFGVELSFAKTLYEQDERYQKGERKLAMIKYAVGATYLLNDRKNNPASLVWLNRILNDAVANISNQLTTLSEEYGDVNVKGMIWMQGESDARSSGNNYRHYSKALNRMITAIRNRLNNAENMHTVFIALNTKAPKLNGRDYWRSNAIHINKTVRNLSKNNHLLTFLGITNGLKLLDGIHYHGDSLIYIGKVAANRIKMIENN